MLSELDQGISLWVALGVAVLFIAFFVKSRLNYLGIPKLPTPSGAASTPDCMVVVPARDEDNRNAQRDPQAHALANVAKHS